MIKDFNVNDLAFWFEMKHVCVCCYLKSVLFIFIDKDLCTLKEVILSDEDSSVNDSLAE